MPDVAPTVRANEESRMPGVEAPAIRVRKAEATDVSELSNLLAAAFFDDPVVTWCYPDPTPRREMLPAAFRTFIGACRAGDEVYTTEGHLAGAVCLPPGTEPDEAQLAALEQISGEYAPRIGELFELMDAGHPHVPHYYLLFLATRPGLQSRGIGSAVLGRLLEHCDHDGVASYLESTSERNRRLYLRHGFEVTDEVRLPGGPPFWRMWREPS